MLDLEDAPSFVEDKDNETMKSVSTKSRGRKKLPILWTRIVDIDESVEDLVDTFSIDVDISTLDDIKATKATKSKKQWEPLFYSKHFWEQN